MEGLGLARMRRLLCKRPGAPLLLTRYSVIVAVHPCSRAILQEELGLTAGCHLRAVGSPVAPVLTLHGFGGIFDSRGWFGGFRLQTLSVLLVPHVAVRAQRNQECKRDECSEGRSKARRVGPPSAWVRGRLAKCLAIDTNRPRLSILTAAKFVGERLTDGWTRSVLWKGADVNEQLATAVCRSNEAKATIVVPGSESALEWHCDGSLCVS
jgi:hypothetical protein